LLAQRPDDETPEQKRLRLFWHFDPNGNPAYRLLKFPPGEEARGSKLSSTGMCTDVIASTIQRRRDKLGSVDDECGGSRWLWDVGHGSSLDRSRACPPPRADA
jgi:hypothetical protein